MKKIILVLVVLAAALLLAPMVAGWQTEEGYNRMLEGVRASGYKVVEHHYTRDWFGATAETELALPMPQQPGGTQAPQDLRFTLVSEIEHGPASPDSGWNGQLAVIRSRFEYEGEPLFPEDYPARIETRVGLTGDGETLVDLPALDQPLQKDSLSIHFDGGKALLKFAPDMSRLDMNLDMSTLRIHEPGKAELVIQGVSGSGHNERGIAGLMMGKGSFRLQSVSVDDMAQGVSMDLRNASVEFSTHAEGELVGVDVSYTFDNMEVAAQSVGPMRLDLTIDNLSASTLAEIEQSMNEINRKGLPEQQRTMAVATTMMAYAKDLLATDPRVEIRHFELGTPDGQVTASLSVQSQGMTMADISNPQAALQKLVADAQVKMPETLVRMMLATQTRNQLVAALAAQEQEMEPAELAQMTEAAVDNQIESLVQQQFVVRDEDALASKASFRSGVLTVNGKSMPLPMGQGM